jgi:23S rRNA (adenine2030-N6)-methyltransferase
MFSYRHAFHAGNHGDVLKHAVLVHLLAHLAQKDKAFWYIDTHAGAGAYDLRGEYARRSGEAAEGIEKLWARDDLPRGLAEYREQIRLYNVARGNGKSLRFYPGSPRIAMQMMRRQDRLRLFEAHPTDSRELRRAFAGEAPRVTLSDQDGFASLNALLPPPPRRGLVLIDPSYEDKADYPRVITALKDGLERFATGSFLVWYPVISRREAQGFPSRLKRIRPEGWLHASLTVSAPLPDGRGLQGSGVFLINPPWTLPKMLAEVLPYLVKHLGRDANASFALEDTLR